MCGHTFNSISLARIVFLVSILIGCKGIDAPTTETEILTDKPVYIFLFIGDGMGRSSEIVASRYLYGEDEGLVWNSFPVRTWASTWDVNTYNAHARTAAAMSWTQDSADPLLGYDPAIGGMEPWKPGAVDALSYYKGGATDSASAATAIATGMKTDSGNIAWASGDPVNGELATIAELMRSHLGSAIGIVSTVPFNHATPASFVSHSMGRGSYAAIADQIINTTKPEVVIGGGHPDSTTAYFSSTALGALRGSDYWNLVELNSGRDGGAALLDAASTLPTGKGLFGLFGTRSDGAFEASVPTSAAGTPDFTRGTDDPTLAVAVQAAATVLSRDSDGFFLMVEQGDIDWANHGNDAERMIGTIASLDEAVQTAIAYINHEGDAIDWSNSLVIVTADHATGLPRFPSSAFMAKGERPIRNPAVSAQWDYAGGSLTYSSTGHGNELVGVAVIGDEAPALFGSTIMDNTAIFSAIADFAGLP